jgi:cytochrome c oxidase subunit 1
VPTAIKVYNWVLTLWRGNIHFNVPMLFAMGFIFTFVNGGLTGLFLGNVTVDVPLSGTYFVVAHFHMVMGVSPIMVVFGAIYHWYPKMTGKFLSDRLGKIHFWCTFLGTYAIYLPMHYLGIMGVPRRYYAYSNSIEFIPLSVQEANKWITISACFVATIQLSSCLIWSGRTLRVSPRAATLGEQLRSNGKPSTTPPRTAIGELSYPSCIAGLTTTASPVHQKTSSPKTFQPVQGFPLDTTVITVGTIK